MALAAGVLTVTGGPAKADVDTVTGSATPLFIGGSPVVPTVSGMATEPTDGFGPIGSGLLSSGPCPGAPTPGPAPIPLVLSVGLLTACTRGAGVAGENHLGFAESSSSVADVVLGTTQLGVVTSQCRADGDGARGSSDVDELHELDVDELDQLDHDDPADHHVHLDDDHDGAAAHNHL
jgi:hypothetical protein